MSSTDKGGGESNVVYYISSSPTPTTIVVIVVILVVVVVAFALSVTCYCYTCRIQKPSYTRLMNGIIAHCSPNVSNPSSPSLPHHSQVPDYKLLPTPLTRSSSDRVIPTQKLSLALKLRRAVSLDEIVTIELPVVPVLRDSCESESPDISPDTLSLESVKNGLGRAGVTSTNHVLLNCEEETSVVRSKGSSPINEEVIIHNERAISPSSVTSSSSLSVDSEHKEMPQLSEHNVFPKHRVDSRRHRVLPKNDLVWSDEITEDEGKKRRGKHEYTRPPKIIPSHLQNRNIEWTDDTDQDIKEEELFPHDSEVISPVVHQFADSSDDEYHSTHSDISVEDLSRLSNENSSKSPLNTPCQDSEATARDYCEEIKSNHSDDVIKPNGDVNSPVEEFQPNDDIKPLPLSRSEASSSAKSGNSSSNSLTLPTKHLVL